MRPNDTRPYLYDPWIIISDELRVIEREALAVPLEDRYAQRALPLKSAASQLEAKTI